MRPIRGQAGNHSWKSADAVEYGGRVAWANREIPCGAGCGAGFRGRRQLRHSPDS